MQAGFKKATTFYTANMFQGQLRDQHIFNRQIPSRNRLPSNGDQHWHQGGQFSISEQTNNQSMAVPHSKPVNPYENMSHSRQYSFVERSGILRYKEYNWKVQHSKKRRSSLCYSIAQPHNRLANRQQELNRMYVNANRMFQQNSGISYLQTINDVGIQNTSSNYGNPAFQQTSGSSYLQTISERGIQNTSSNYNLESAIGDESIYDDLPTNDVSESGLNNRNLIEVPIQTINSESRDGKGPTHVLSQGNDRTTHPLEKQTDSWQENKYVVNDTRRMANVELGNGASRMANVELGNGASRMANVDLGNSASRMANVQLGNGANRMANFQLGNRASRMANIELGNGASRMAYVELGNGASRIANVELGNGASRMENVDLGNGASRMANVELRNGHSRMANVELVNSASRMANVDLSQGASRPFNAQVGMAIGQHANVQMGSSYIVPEYEQLGKPKPVLVQLGVRSNNKMIRNVSEIAADFISGLMDRKNEHISYHSNLNVRNRPSALSPAGDWQNIKSNQDEDRLVVSQANNRPTGEIIKSPMKQAVLSKGKSTSTDKNHFENNVKKSVVEKNTKYFETVSQLSEQVNLKRSAAGMYDSETNSRSNSQKPSHITRKDMVTSEHSRYTNLNMCKGESMTDVHNSGSGKSDENDSTAALKAVNSSKSFKLKSTNIKPRDLFWNTRSPLSPIQNLRKRVRFFGNVVAIEGDGMTVIKQLNDSENHRKLKDNFERRKPKSTNKKIKTRQEYLSSGSVLRQQILNDALKMNPVSGKYSKWNKDHIKERIGKLKNIGDGDVVKIVDFESVNNGINENFKSDVSVRQEENKKVVEKANTDNASEEQNTENGVIVVEDMKKRPNSETQNGEFKALNLSTGTCSRNLEIDINNSSVELKKGNKKKTDVKSKSGTLTDAKPVTSINGRTKEKKKVDKNRHLKKERTEKKEKKKELFMIEAIKRGVKDRNYLKQIVENEPLVKLVKPEKRRVSYSENKSVGNEKQVNEGQNPQVKTLNEKSSDKIEEQLKVTTEKKRIDTTSVDEGNQRQGSNVHKDKITKCGMKSKQVNQDMSHKSFLKNLLHDESRSISKGKLHTVVSVEVNYVSNHTEENKSSGNASSEHHKKVKGTNTLTHKVASMKESLQSVQSNFCNRTAAEDQPQTVVSITSKDQETHFEEERNRTLQCKESSANKVKPQKNVKITEENRAMDTTSNNVICAKVTTTKNGSDNAKKSRDTQEPKKLNFARLAPESSFVMKAVPVLKLLEKSHTQKASSKSNEINTEVKGNKTSEVTGIKTEVKGMKTSEVKGIKTDVKGIKTQVKVKGMKTSAAKGMKTSEVKGMKTSEVKGIKTDVKGIKTQVQVKGMKTSEVKGIKTQVKVKGMKTSAVKGMKTSEVMGMKTSEVNGIKTEVKEMKTSEVKGMKTSEVMGMKTSEVNGIKTEVKAMKTSEVKGMKTSEIKGMKTSEVKGIKTEVKETKTSEVKGMKTSEVKGIKMGVKGIKIMVKGMNTSTVKGSKTDVQDIETSAIKGIKSTTLCLTNLKDNSRASVLPKGYPSENVNVPSVSIPESKMIPVLLKPILKSNSSNATNVLTKKADQTATLNTLKALLFQTVLHGLGTPEHGEQKFKKKKLRKKKHAKHMSVEVKQRNTNMLSDKQKSSKQLGEKQKTINDDKTFPDTETEEYPCLPELAINPEKLPKDESLPEISHYSRKIYDKEVHRCPPTPKLVINPEQSLENKQKVSSKAEFEQIRKRPKLDVNYPTKENVCDPAQKRQLDSEKVEQRANKRRNTEKGVNIVSPITLPKGQSKVKMAGSRYSIKFVDEPTLLQTVSADTSLLRSLPITSHQQMILGSARRESNFSEINNLQKISLEKQQLTTKNDKDHLRREETFEVPVTGCRNMPNFNANNENQANVTKATNALKGQHSKGTAKSRKGKHALSWQDIFPVPENYYKYGTDLEMSQHVQQHQYPPPECPLARPAVNLCQISRVPQMVNSTSNVPPTGKISPTYTDEQGFNLQVSSTTVRDEIVSAPGYVTAETTSSKLYGSNFQDNQTISNMDVRGNQFPYGNHPGQTVVDNSNAKSRVQPSYVAYPISHIKGLKLREQNTQQNVGSLYQSQSYLSAIECPGNPYMSVNNRTSETFSTHIAFGGNPQLSVSNQNSVGNTSTSVTYSKTAHASTVDFSAQNCRKTVRNVGKETTAQMNTDCHQGNFQSSNFSNFVQELPKHRNQNVLWRPDQTSSNVKAPQQGPTLLQHNNLGHVNQSGLLQNRFVENANMSSTQAMYSNPNTHNPYLGHMFNPRLNLSSYPASMAVPPQINININQASNFVNNQSCHFGAVVSMTSPLEVNCQDPLIYTNTLQPCRNMGNVTGALVPKATCKANMALSQNQPIAHSLNKKTWKSAYLNTSRSSETAERNDNEQKTLLPQSQYLAKQQNKNVYCKEAESIKNKPVPSTHLAVQQTEIALPCRRAVSSTNRSMLSGVESFKQDKCTAMRKELVPSTNMAVSSSVPNVQQQTCAEATKEMGSNKNMSYVSTCSTIKQQNCAKPGKEKGSLNEKHAVSTVPTVKQHKVAVLCKETESIIKRKVPGSVPTFEQQKCALPGKGTSIQRHAVSTLPSIKQQASVIPCKETPSKNIPKPCSFPNVDQQQCDVRGKKTVSSKSRNLISSNPTVEQQECSVSLKEMDKWKEMPAVSTLPTVQQQECTMCKEILSSMHRPKTSTLPTVKPQELNSPVKEKASIEKELGPVNDVSVDKNVLKSITEQKMESPHAENTPTFKQLFDKKPLECLEIECNTDKETEKNPTVYGETSLEKETKEDGRKTKISKTSKQNSSLPNIGMKFREPVVVLSPLVLTEELNSMIDDYLGNNQTFPLNDVINTSDPFSLNTSATQSPFWFIQTPSVQGTPILQTNRYTSVELSPPVLSPCINRRTPSLRVLREDLSKTKTGKEKCERADYNLRQRTVSGGINKHKRQSKRIGKILPPRTFYREKDLYESAEKFLGDNFKNRSTNKRKKPTRNAEISLNTVTDRKIEKYGHEIPKYSAIEALDLCENILEDRNGKLKGFEPDENCFEATNENDIKVNPTQKQKGVVNKSKEDKVNDIQLCTIENKLEKNEKCAQTENQLVGGSEVQPDTNETGEFSRDESSGNVSGTREIKDVAFPKKRGRKKKNTGKCDESLEDRGIKKFKVCLKLNEKSGIIKGEKITEPEMARDKVDAKEVKLKEKISLKNKKNKKHHVNKTSNSKFGQTTSTGVLLKKKIETKDNGQCDIVEKLDDKCVMTSIGNGTKCHSETCDTVESMSGEKCAQLKFPSSTAKAVLKVSDCEKDTIDGEIDDLTSVAHPGSDEHFDSLKILLVKKQTGKKDLDKVEYLSYKNTISKSIEEIMTSDDNELNSTKQHFDKKYYEELKNIPTDEENWPIADTDENKSLKTSRLSLKRGRSGHFSHKCQELKQSDDISKIVDLFDSSKTNSSLGEINKKQKNSRKTLKLTELTDVMTERKLRNRTKSKVKVSGSEDDPALIVKTSEQAVVGSGQPKCTELENGSESLEKQIKFNVHNISNDQNNLKDLSITTNVEVVTSNTKKRNKPGKRKKKGKSKNVTDTLVEQCEVTEIEIAPENKGTNPVERCSISKDDANTKNSQKCLNNVDSATSKEGVNLNSKIKTKPKARDQLKKVKKLKSKMSGRCSGDPVTACPVCGMVSPNNASLRDHLKDTHPYCCTVCKKEFDSKEAKSDHSWIHRSCIFYCDICNRRFSNKYARSLHIKSKSHLAAESIASTRWYEQQASQRTEQHAAQRKVSACWEGELGSAVQSILENTTTGSSCLTNSVTESQHDIATHFGNPGLDKRWENTTTTWQNNCSFLENQTTTWENNTMVWENNMMRVNQSDGSQYIIEIENVENWNQCQTGAKNSPTEFYNNLQQGSDSTNNFMVEMPSDNTLEFQMGIIDGQSCRNQPKNTSGLEMLANVCSMANENENITVSNTNNLCENLWPEASAVDESQVAQQGISHLEEMTPEQYTDDINSNVQVVSESEEPYTLMKDEYPVCMDDGLDTTALCRIANSFSLASFCKDRPGN